MKRAWGPGGYDPCGYPERRAVPIILSPELESSVVARLRTAGCVFAEEEARLLLEGASTSTELDRLVERRVSGLPLEQVLGWAGFYGLRLVVETGVFVPRRRTEFLVERAIALVRGLVAPVVADLCCGVGAVGAAIAANVAGLDLYAVDIQPAAVRCARQNIGDSGQVFLGDLFGPLPATLRGRVDLLVANAPYVPTAAIATMPPEARIHEDHVVLDGGPDGLGVHRRIAASAWEWLAPGGSVLVEISEDQAGGSAGIFAANGLAPTIARFEELDATVIIAVKFRPAPAVYRPAV